jgi:hypothetical protein
MLGALNVATVQKGPSVYSYVVCMNLFMVVNYLHCMISS